MAKFRIFSWSDFSCPSATSDSKYGSQTGADPYEAFTTICLHFSHEIR